MNTKKAIAACSLVVLTFQAAAQPVCGPMSDPNNPFCAKTQAPGLNLGAGASENSPPKAVGYPQYPKTGFPMVQGSMPVLADAPNTICLQLDPSGQRCLVFAPTKSNYEKAIQDGVDGALDGMGIQQDIQRRLYGTVPR